MNFKFECPHCGQRIEAQAASVGVVAQCPTCQQALVVPDPPTGRAIAKTGPNAPAPSKFWPCTLRLVLWSGAGIFAVLLAICVLLVIGAPAFRSNAPQATPAAQTATSPSMPTTAPKVSQAVENNPGTTLRAVERLELPPPSAEDLAGAIRRVNSQLLASNQTVAQIRNPSLLPYALAEFASQSSTISAHGCPEDFVVAWKQYITSLNEMANSFRKAATAGQIAGGNSFQNDQQAQAGAAIALGMMVAIAQLENTEKGVESSAAKYGVKWRKLAELAK